MARGGDYKKLQESSLARAESYVARLRKLYDAATSRLIGMSTDVEYDGGGQFYFDDYPELLKEVNATVERLATGIEQTILRATTAEWTKGVQGANGTVDYVLQKAGIKSVDDLTDDAIGQYFNNHADALAAFQKRQIGGMSLSDKVWDLAEHQKIETELARSIAEGTSADELAKSMQEWLQEPDKLFRRVRDEYGTLRLSKNASAYTPEPGAYRSSYKNALRLARTEINMAYRNAEIESYQDKDYVVGFEVHRSTNPYPCPVCEALAGKYPKDFMWNGWHPQCRCYVIPILLTDEEMAARRDAIINGEEFDSEKSVNAVHDVPEGFKKWVENNSARIEGSYSRGRLPYFLGDNKWAWAKQYSSIVEKFGMGSAAEASKPIASWLDGKSFVVDGSGMSDEEYCRKFRKALRSVYGNEENWKKLKEVFEIPLLAMKDGRYDIAAEFFRERTPVTYLRQIESVNKVAEINKLYKQAVKLGIPDTWKRELDSCIAAINANKPGYLFENFREVESAYNIVKLATNYRVYLHGFENVSMRMPENLLRLKGIKVDWSDIDKKFFDRLEHFVPLETRWHPYQGGYSKEVVGNDAFFWDLKPQMVVLPLETSPACLSRWKRCSESEFMRVVYHEYGHVIDFGNGTRISTVDTDFLKFYKKFYGISDNRYNDMLRIFDEQVDKILDSGNREAMTQASDIIQALRKDADHSRLYGGHNDDYYDAELWRLREIFANGTALRYLGNDMLKAIAPDIYEALVELMEKLY